MTGKTKKCGKDDWIRCALAKHKPGSLHRQLHVAKGDKIPVKDLNRAIGADIGDEIMEEGEEVTVTRLLKKRAVLAKTLRSFHKKKK
jgi:hypothetical protein